MQFIIADIKSGERSSGSELKVLRSSGSQRRMSWDSENRRLPSTTGSVPIESGCGEHWTCMQARSQSRLGGRGRSSAQVPADWSAMVFALGCIDRVL